MWGKDVFPRSVKGNLEEREGFEPSEPRGSPDFESGTFDHSATSPVSFGMSSPQSYILAQAICLAFRRFYLEYGQATHVRPQRLR